MEPVQDVHALHELRAELAAMRTELGELRAENAAMRARLAPAADGGGEVLEHRATRRGMLRLAGAAAAGAAAAAVGASGQAAATNDQAVFLGDQNFATRTTTLSYGTGDSVDGAAVQGGPAATAMLRVETNFSNSYAIYGVGSGHGIAGDGTDSGFISFNGKYSFQSAAATTAALLLRDIHPGSVAKTPPPSRVDLHVRGELECDANGDLWWCVADGTPGQWRKITGPTSAGSFHPISPVRVYDSRAALPAPGVLGGGASRVVSVKDARPGDTGAVTTPDVVPAGATAIAYNLTIAETTGAGFLAVAEGTAGSTSGSSINWSATGQLLANGLVVKLDADRQVKVFSGGGGSTHFIIDVLGYYR